MYCWLKKDAQHESCELSSTWGDMRPAAQETAPQITLRNCSREVLGEGQYIQFWWRESLMWSSTYFTKDFLLATRSWCHHEGDNPLDNPLQCSCLENPRDGGAWWAAVYGVTQNQTQLKRLSISGYKLGRSLNTGNISIKSQDWVKTNGCLNLCSLAKVLHVSEGEGWCQGPEIKEPRSNSL